MAPLPPAARLALLAGAAAWLPGGRAAPSAEMKKLLDKHNVYRCMHGVPLLTWDDDIAASAQAWADNAQYQHSTSSQRMINGEQCGENLAIGTSLSGEKAVQLWYEEIQYTEPYGTADSMADTTKSGEAIGHYTQLVWKSSTKLGCGMRANTPSGSGWSGTYWVCQYGPAGNYVGQFSTQVVKPVKDESACGGSGSATTSGINGASNDGNTNNPVDNARPSSCTPSPLLPPGGLCVYGYQCASSFCCPRLKVCLACSSCSVSSGDIKIKDEALQSSITAIIFGGVCDDPYSNSQKCRQTGDGQPLDSWDQSACGCDAEYMARYAAGTWVTLNDIDGMTGCEPGQTPQTGLTSSAPIQALASGVAALALVTLAP